MADGRVKTEKPRQRRIGARELVDRLTRNEEPDREFKDYLFDNGATPRRGRSFYTG